MKKVLFLVMSLLAFPSVLFAAGTVTGPVTTWVQGQNFKVMKVSWTGDAADGTVPATDIGNIDGFVHRVVTDPLSPAPTDNYAVYLKEKTTGNDIMAGVTINRDTANTEQAFPKVPGSTDFYAPVYTTGIITFSVTGNSVLGAKGDVYIYVETK